MNRVLDKRKIENVNFQILASGKATEEEKKSFAKDASWILPQLLAYIGRTDPVKNEAGRYDGRLTAQSLINNYKGFDANWIKGALVYLTLAPRGLLFPGTIKATSATLLPYCALVPLFLAAFKKFHDIPYSSWDNISKVIDKDLYSAMTCTVPEMTTEEILACLDVGSTVKSGKSAGTKKSPTSVTNITTTGFSDFDELPRLAKIMISQAWVAHPVYRHEYMVLDPSNWDNMPKPLISTEIFQPTSEQKEEMPWD